MVSAEKSDVDFGLMLRRAREARGVTLRQIATATKISVAVLEALERNEIARLPGGIFGRAVVRAYALEVGLDPEDSVRDFIARFPQESVTVGSPHVPYEDQTAIESTRHSAQTVVRLVAIAVPLAAAIVYVTVPAGPAALAFELRAAGAMRLEVTVDGARGEARMIEAGERLAFTSLREVTITTSDAGAVELTINGRRAAPLGLPGAARTVRIRRDNYDSFLTPH